MAKFRTNHNKQSMGGSQNVAKVGIFALILAGLFGIFNLFSGGGDGDNPATDQPPRTQQDEPSFMDREKFTATYMLPTSTSGEIIKQKHYASSYVEEHEQAEWVAYELTREQIEMPWVQRPRRFIVDPKVRKASASSDDYTGTGYNRGHLVPAADFAFSEDAILETFYMSNISPQVGNFNSGIWRELEENVRDWAKQSRHLYIVTGPVLSRNIRERIGGNEVSVPDEFYKVILDYTEPELKAIGFIIPNQLSVDPLIDFAVSVDEVEEITGLDFFPNLLGENEEILESDLRLELWSLDEDKYTRRVRLWNKLN